MKMIKKIVISALILLFVLMPLTYAQVGWNEDTENTVGEWDFKSHTQWKSTPNIAQERLVYHYYPSEVDVFSLWDTKFTSHIYITNVGSVAQVVELYFGNDTHWVCVQLWWKKTVWSHFFGLFQGVAEETSVWISNPENYSEMIEIHTELANYIPHVVMYRNASNNLNIAIALLTEINSTNSIWCYEQNYTLPEGVFSDFTLDMWIWEIHISYLTANAYIEGSKSEILILDGSIIPDYDIEGTLDFWENLKTQLWHIVTNAWNGFTSWATDTFGWMGDLWNYLSYGLTFIVGLFQNAVQYIPLFISLYPIWFLTILVTALVEWKFGILEEHLLGIYHFFANIIDMIVNILQTIWEYIKFW